MERNWDESHKLIFYLSLLSVPVREKLWSPSINGRPISFRRPWRPSFCHQIHSWRLGWGVVRNKKQVNWKRTSYTILVTILSRPSSSHFFVVLVWRKFHIDLPFSCLKHIFSLEKLLEWDFEYSAKTWVTKKNKIDPRDYV